MDENGALVAGFDPEQYARVVRAAQLVGKTPQVFVRDAALAAADDPFIKALGDAGTRVRNLAEVFGTQDTRAAGDDSTAWPDPAPMSSRDLHEIEQHGHAA
ncbi:hypothetical protein [Streptomyces liliifuscus]|uniref:Uncharacterized protein n=1 Tax=Streptomyces liliifuscus TaxID=2797636 RepID=A0A7T7L4H1_9ACTN|nr:hypothetical protein [Streptomyces liliifuscus]QQM46240.1 hypothetical protein JEQ17_47040 [Streptomyces liliifuscus]